MQNIFKTVVCVLKHDKIFNDETTTEGLLERPSFSLFVFYI